MRRAVMKTFGSVRESEGHAHAEGEAVTPARLPRRDAAHAGAGGEATQAGGGASFADAVNAGIHAPQDAVQAAIAGGGRGLDAGARTRMERSFGADFGDVRIHDGAAAASSATELGAAGYAVGNDIVFGGGQYQPETAQGSWLLAHELGHTLQQQGGVQKKALEIGDVGDPMEAAADRAADRVMAGETNVGAGMPREGAVLRRFPTAVPWEPSSRWVAAPMGSHSVETHATGKVFPAGGAASEVAFGSADASIAVPAATSGVIQIMGHGHYEVNNGTFLESMPDIGDFRWRADWRYRCTEERALSIRETTPTFEQDRGTRRLLGENVAVSAAATTEGGTEVATPLTFSQGGDGGASVDVRGVGIPVPGSSATGMFQIVPRLHLSVTGGHAPTPAPAPPVAEAHAHADAEASATVITPMPAPVPVPETHQEFFAREGQMEGDRAALVRWAATIAHEAQAAIRTQRLRVTVIGFASTTGSEALNFERYAAGRARWARGVLAATWGVPEATVQVGNRGDATAPAADHAPPAGVANPHERRVDIVFDEVAPMEPATVTARRSAHADTEPHR